MPQYVIEREIPGAGDLSQDDLKGIRPKSFEVTVTGGLDVGVIHGQITGDHDLQPRRGTVPSKKYSPRPSLAEERVCSALKSCS